MILHLLLHLDSYLLAALCLKIPEYPYRSTYTYHCLIVIPLT